jgi:hypothetical protein
MLAVLSGLGKELCRQTHRVKVDDCRSLPIRRAFSSALSLLLRLAEQQARACTPHISVLWGLREGALGSPASPRRGQTPDCRITGEREKFVLQSSPMETFERPSSEGYRIPTPLRGSAFSDLGGIPLSAAPVRSLVALIRLSLREPWHGRAVFTKPVKRRVARLGGESQPPVARARQEPISEEEWCDGRPRFRNSP